MLTLPGTVLALRRSCCNGCACSRKQCSVSRWTRSSRSFVLESNMYVQHSAPYYHNQGHG
jgi:hypothetical protein